MLGLGINPYDRFSHDKVYLILISPELDPLMNVLSLSSEEGTKSTLNGFPWPNSFASFSLAAKIED